MTHELRLAQLRDVERWISWARLAGVVFALLEVLAFTSGYPGGYETAAVATTCVFAVGSLALFVLARRVDRVVPLGYAALAFDLAFVTAYATIFSYEWGSPARWALIFVVVEAALRSGLRGGVGIGLVLIPDFAFLELWRAHHFGPPGFVADRVSFPAGVHLLTGAIVGWLVTRLDRQATVAHVRAVEAEELRDELGRRVDTLEAVNRCARALGSSLDLQTAFGAFIRELRGVIPFDRTTIALVDGDEIETIAVTGVGAEQLGPVGTRRPIVGSLSTDILQGVHVLRDDMLGSDDPIELDLVRLGLRTRIGVPLLVGARPIGALSVLRREAGSFSADEVELTVLLGRLGGTAVQNLRAYESERRTADELRRLSALRADFVSLVSHELRSPMAAVIGAARTLQHRWRQLSHDQRDAFLALIGDETDRLTSLIGDVLDTSRIEAGTFSFSFGELDVAEVVAEAVAAAELAQDEVPVQARVRSALPRIRGDRERLRQVMSNLIENAVKYSPAGEPVLVAAGAENGVVRVEVRDRGPGISAEQQAVIFEKFGRANAPGGSGKPGTGLGLFIARSIAEAHGGSLAVRSTPGEGSTFTLMLPV